MTHLSEALRRRDWSWALAEVHAGAPDPPAATADERAWLKRQRISIELYVAAERGDVPGIRRLIEKGADPNIKIVSGLLMSPLVRAAICDQPEAVEALLAAGAEVDLRTTSEHSGGFVSDSTALTWASRENSLAAARVLLDAGADPNIRECAWPKFEKGCRPWENAYEAAASDEMRRLISSRAKHPRRGRS